MFFNRNKNKEAQQTESPKPYVFTNLEDLVFYTAMIVSLQDDYRVADGNPNWNIQESELLSLTKKLQKASKDDRQGIYATSIEKINDLDVLKTIRDLEGKKVLFRSRRGSLSPNPEGWNKKIEQANKENKSLEYSKEVENSARKVIAEHLVGNNSQHRI